MKYLKWNMENAANSVINNEKKDTMYIHNNSDHFSRMC